MVPSQVVISALNWRWLLVLTSLPCFLLLPFFRIIPESPCYLCAQNRMSDTTLVLESVSMINQAALPPGVLTYRRESKVDTLTSETEIDHLLPIRETEMECKSSNALSFKSGAATALRRLLSPALCRPTLLLWFVYFANSFAYYGVLLLMSQLSDANRNCPSDPGLLPARALSGLPLIFLFFYMFQNGQKLPLMKFWSWFTYRITYLFLFRVLERSIRFPLCTPPVSLTE